jgi:hypothetical protein
MSSSRARKRSSGGWWWQIVVLLLLVIMAYVNLASRTRLPQASWPEEEEEAVEQQQQQPQSHIGDLRTCHRNPYLTALTDYNDAAYTDPLRSLLARMEQTLAVGIGQDLHQASTQWRDYEDHTHARFFPLSPLTSCRPEEQRCIGGPCSSDESKIVCGIGRLEEAEELSAAKEKKTESSSCVVYSIGGNNQWAFEQGILQETNCEVHTFDCTGPRSRFRPRLGPQYADRHTFHHVCVGTEHQAAPATCEGNIHKCGETWTLAEMQQRLGHAQIDLLKMDVEGYEWPLFRSWFSDPSSWGALPMQVMVEIHYQTHMTDLHLHPGDNKLIVTMVGLIDLAAELIRAGYAIAVRDDNPMCLHCTELTILRVAC